MRKGPEVEFDEDMEGNYDFQVDWREDPKSALEAANATLKQHGFEFINHANDGDFYAFSIRPIAASKKG